MAEISIFNQQQLLVSSADDADLAAQVASTFLADIPVQLQALEEAVNNNDSATAERAAHSIKGASATVGVGILQQDAFACEQAAHNGDLDTARTLTATMKKHFPAVRQAMADAGYVE